MKFYSHRGNVTGVDSTAENNPAYIDTAIKLGFDVEIDLRIIGNDFFLGHDYPVYKVAPEWLDDRAEHLLIHVKDFKALKRILAECYLWHYFCHQNDPFTITSRGYIWVHDINVVTHKNCIVPLIGEDHVNSYELTKLYGVCSDFILQCRERFQCLET